MINKSYQDARIETREEESLETLSEDREWLYRCDVRVTEGRSACWRRQLGTPVCRLYTETNGRYF